MLGNCKSVSEHRGNINQTIHSWLHERQDMLVRYCALSDLESFAKGEKEALRESIRQLCEAMMDYVSAGHFKVYEELLRESRNWNDGDALEWAFRLYAIVEQTTDAVLDFNDKYQEVDDLSALARDLSHLGEQLATRFEAEDRMITLMRKAHKHPVA